MADPGRPPHSDSEHLLRHLKVRTIGPEERAKRDALVEQHHHLGLHGLFRKTLRRIATAEGCWSSLRTLAHQPRRTLAAFSV